MQDDTENSSDMPAAADSAPFHFGTEPEMPTLQGFRREITENGHELFHRTASLTDLLLAVGRTEKNRYRRAYAHLMAGIECLTELPGAVQDPELFRQFNDLVVRLTDCVLIRSS